MIRILVVDDSALVRKVLSDLLSSEPDFVVIDTAQDGKEAIEKLQSTGADLILMDIEMPVMDGVAAVKKIMAEWPIPIILFSGTSSRDSERVLEAMDAGAVDFIVKPSDGFSGVKEELVLKIKEAALARLHRYRRTHVRQHNFMPTSKKIVVIAASTGGPPTIERLLTELPGNVPAPILIVQHMPAAFTHSFAKRLDAITEVSVREARDGDHLEDGVVFIAPGGKHMEVALDNGITPLIRLNEDPPELGVRPCANRLFKSAAAIFKDRTLGVVLTGMGHDGRDGAIAIKHHHGTVIAESEESSVIFGMPKEVIKADLADAVVNVEKMAVSLVELIDV